MTEPTPGGFTDLHSHLVPGVDDGARTVEEALQGIEALVDAGIRRIVTGKHTEAVLSL